MIPATIKICENCRFVGKLKPPATGHCYMTKKKPVKGVCEGWKRDPPQKLLEYLNDTIT